MSRVLTVGAAQMGPIQLADTRPEVVGRLVALLRSGAAAGCDLVVFPELTLTTFFPRWWVDDLSDSDHFYETEMPGPETRPLFEEARRLGVGFHLGYAELTSDGHRYKRSVVMGKIGAFGRRRRLQK